MKKYYSFILTIIMLFLLCSCANAENEKLFIRYKGELFDSYIADNYVYSDFWFPLSEPDLEDFGYFDTKSSKTRRQSIFDRKKILIFSDKTLNMFIQAHDFFGDYLYCNINSKLPNYLDNKLDIEEIIIKNDEKLSWRECYDNDNTIRIVNQEDIALIIDDIIQIEKSSNSFETYNVAVVFSGVEIGVKFKELNAIYYLGMVNNDGNDSCYFYNATNPESVSYKLNNDILIKYIEKSK